MIGLHRIAAYLPSQTVDNIARAAQFGESEGFLREKIGATETRVRASDEDTSDLAVAAAERLFAEVPHARADVDALIVVTQNPDGYGVPHTAGIVQHKLGLGTQIAAFDISLACSGYVYGLSVLRGLLETAGLRNGVLITADPYSKIINPADRVTSLLFGDAATATWLGVDAPWRIGTPLFGTDGSGASHIQRVAGGLEMNGRQVFNFAGLQVPKQISGLLEREGLAPEAIDAYLVHQGSAAIVDAIRRRFPSVAGRIPCELDKVGNTVSSSIPLMLAGRLGDPSLDRVLLCGFGVGLSWSSLIISRNSKVHSDAYRS